MKCPHCGKEHDNSALFCQYTGKFIKKQSLVCINPDCNYRMPLPITAKFCPHCGKLLNSTIVMDKYVSTPFCCMIETTEEKYLTMFSHLNEYRKFKFVSSTGELLSEQEFHIVAKTKKRFEKSEYIHQLLLFEMQNNHLYYLNSKGLLTKIDRYGDEDGFREGKSYWDNKWRYDAELIDENHILYRNGTTYSLYNIGSEGVPVLTNKFSTKLHNLCRGTLIGDYICTDKASIRISDGCYETILGYKRCRCIGYNNGDYIFAASRENDWNIREMENGCDIVDLKGNVLWRCNNYSVYEFNKSYVTVFNEEENQGLLSILNGEIVIPVGDYYLELTHFEDIIEVYHKGSGAFSISEKKFYQEFESSGDYYILTENVPGGYIVSLFNSVNEVLYQLKTGDVDDSPYCLLKANDGQNVPLCINFKGEIISLDYSNTIYHFDEESEEFIGVSYTEKRFAVYNGTVIEVVDFNGNILNDIFVEEEWRDAVMCTNGYILLYNPQKRELKYYDLNFDVHTLRLSKLKYNNPKELYAGDMYKNAIITLCDSGRNVCVVLTITGDIIYDYCKLEIVCPGILKNYDSVVYLEKSTVINNCTEIII